MSGRISTPDHLEAARHIDERHFSPRLFRDDGQGPQLDFELLSPGNVGRAAMRQAIERSGAAPTDRRPMPATPRLDQAGPSNWQNRPAGQGLGGIDAASPGAGQRAAAARAVPPEQVTPPRPLFTTRPLDRTANRPAPNGSAANGAPPRPARPAMPLLPGYDYPMPGQPNGTAGTGAPNGLASAMRLLSLGQAPDHSPQPPGPRLQPHDLAADGRPDRISPLGLGAGGVRRLTRIADVRARIETLTARIAELDLQIQNHRIVADGRLGTPSPETQAVGRLLNRRDEAQAELDGLRAQLQERAGRPI